MRAGEDFFSPTNLFVRYALATYRDVVQFVEHPRFTKRVPSLLDDSSYGDFLAVLMDRPDIGALIPHGGGLRKVRWQRAGTGKSGGVRVIYYLQDARGLVTLAAIYAKNEKENLGPAELSKLRKELGL